MKWLATFILLTGCASPPIIVDQSKEVEFYKTNCEAILRQWNVREKENKWQMQLAFAGGYWIGVRDGRTAVLMNTNISEETWEAKVRWSWAQMYPEEPPMDYVP